MVPDRQSTLCSLPHLNFVVVLSTAPRPCQPGLCDDAVLVSYRPATVETIRIALPGSYMQPQYLHYFIRGLLGKSRCHNRHNRAGHQPGQEATEELYTPYHRCAGRANGVLFLQLILLKHPESPETTSRMPRGK